jgi:TRAP-type C4-dicarboxylate transport system permease small subunit
MTRWPWISLLLAVLIVISPVGREIIHDAFYSGEALSRNIAQALIYIALGIAALIIALEWLVRLIISRRRARGATSS